MKTHRISDYTSLYQLASRQAGLLKHITVRKVMNGAGILREYLGAKTVLKNRPVVVRLDPTTHCNLACPNCHPDGNTFGGHMSQTVFDVVLDALPWSYMMKGSLYLFGEPLVNPNLPAMIKAVLDRGVSTGISTNFNVLSEKKANALIDSGLSWILICVDGADQAAYEKYRVNGKLERVLDNIKTLVRVKRKRRSRTPIIEVQTIVFEHNRHQIDKIREMCFQLGVERFTIKRDCYEQMGIDLRSLPGKGVAGDPEFEAKRLARVAVTQEKKRPLLKAKKNGRPATCHFLYGTANIDYDGAVLPCSSVGRHPFGNLLENSFDEIWNNDRFVAARTFFASGHTEKATEFELPCYTCPLFFPDNEE